jgi:hypothetical protein
MANTRSLAGERSDFFDWKRGTAEGATAPETLRQKDRDRVMNFWKAMPPLIPIEGRSPPKG